MDIEQAIQTAIEYEKKVFAVYNNAQNTAKSDVAKKVFALMAEEEQGHVDYLEHKLKTYREDQSLSSDDLKTALPNADRIREAATRLSQKLTAEDKAGELDLLEQAREVETETSNYYKKLVNELPEEGRRFFDRFVEIEMGHLALVEAEIDAVSGMGFWFGMPEFNLENA